MALSEILVVAGEASGDQHAAALVSELKRRRPDLRFFGMGGPKMAAAGVDLVFGAHEISVMGISEVLPKLRRILSVMKKLLAASERRKPICAILVDVPDFNLRVARELKAAGIPVVYYVSPMLWAWRQGRVEQVEARVDRMLCILPFEEDFYRRRGVKARYVGNPVVEQVPPPAKPETFRRALGLPLEPPILALLPGSRRSELKQLLPPMVKAAQVIAEKKPGLHVVVPVAPGIAREEIARQLAHSGLHRTLIDGRAAEVVGASDGAIVASGTATLEAGLMLRPMAVVYRVAPISYLVGRALLRVRFISLVNLLLDRAAVPELIQSAAKPRRIADALLGLWDPPARDRVVADLGQLYEVLGPPGAASRAADEILSVLRG